MNSQNTKNDNTGNGVSKDESQIVKRLFTALLLTVKNLSLYPPGHTICTNSISKFYTQLTAFLKKYGTLKLEIERDRILCKGEIISQGIPEEGTLHYTFFRDGIRWIELIDGIGQVELTDIFMLINRYTKLSAEPEGDIVTAFWEVQFPHMQYEVAELLWEGDQGSEEVSDLLSGKAKLTQEEEPEKREKEYQGDPPIDMTKVLLTPEEETELQEMIRLEQETDRTSYLDVLLDSLLQHREEMNFIKIMEALSEEFSLSLGRKDFVITLKILQGLQYVLDICREEIPWADSLIKEFFLKASSVEALAPLKNIWDQVDQDDAPVIKDIFMFLNPKAIQILLSFLSKPQRAPVRKMLLELITMLAAKDSHSLELALNNTNENLLERLIALIVKMEGGQSVKYLLKLSHHPAGRIRYEAVKGILKWEPARIKDMLNLIDDSEDSIRQLILDQMGQSRNTIMEEFLISYIKKNKSGSIDANFLLQCFRTLGKCGSLQSVPFLSETLLKWGFLPGARRSILRKGAAIALGKMNIPQADEVLERAGRSMFPGVKGAVLTVSQELKEEEDSSVEGK